MRNPQHKLYNMAKRRTYPRLLISASSQAISHRTGKIDDKTVSPNIFPPVNRIRMVSDDSSNHLGRQESGQVGDRVRNSKKNARVIGR